MQKISFFKSIMLTAVISLSFTCLVKAATIDSDRVKYSFNPGWKLYHGDAIGADKADFNDKDWQSITLPHASNEDDAFKVDIHNLSTGISWYRKHFKLPANYADKKIFIEFEGIRQAGEVYLNGEFVGRCENGVMAFGFDLSKYLKFGGTENVMAVRCDNSWTYKEKATNAGYHWNNANFYANYGGIAKNVFLHVTGKLYQTLPLFSTLGTTGIYVYAKDFDIAGKQAIVTAEAQVKNEYPTSKNFQYEVRVDDKDGKTIKTFDGGQNTLAAGETKVFKASAKLSNLNFWSWGYGYLYTVYTIIKVDGKVVDVVKTKTGFRKTEFGNGMVKLNDRVIQMHGYAQRTTNEWPAIGLSVPAWMSDYSNGLAVESGGNLVRWMHVTPWKQDVESCDRVGMIQSMPAGDAEGDSQGRQWQQRLELMRDAIIYNRNNPSIMFYESGNKGVSEEHMKNMKAIRDEYDPNGGRASGSREMLDSKIAEYGGEMLYINKSARIPFWAHEYSRDEGLRTYWDELTPPYHKDGAGPKRKEEPGPYNHNMDSFAAEDVARWFDYWHERPGTGKRVSSGGVNIVWSDSNTHFRGEENYRTSGEVDAMRIAKDAFYAHQVMWDGWVDLANNHSYIIGHWNYVKDVKKNVMVVSTGDKVELFVNGKSKGFGEQSSHFLFTFKDIAFQPGTIKAISYDTKGNKLSETEKKTTGEAVALKLTVHTGPNGLKADGADLALVDIEVVDAVGNRVPTAFNKIDFNLSGPAEWRGGIAHGAPDNFILAKSLPVAGGINRVIIRSSAIPGKITLNAASEGLKTASVTFDSKLFAVDNGLANFIPGSDLTASLKRGPTPAGPSYTVSRIPVTVVSATAGSNAADAEKSYDDNELTSWVNDGTLANAWIKYTFDKPETVSEITMKLNGWRTKKYPIKIKVGDEVVFSGTTKQSLGYVTIPFKATKGSTLTVELAGATAQEDKLGLVEVTGKKDDAGSVGLDPKGKSVLGINEIEIYHKP
ncbi:MAG: sugar-binding domain-containing protein [Mucilaginibacter sp.]|uniref:glycoside hydrolase family 2 protein n=1 Tax=Mucilaginibacter sp. TaxID=1882438 RepID=UPI003263238E